MTAELTPAFLSSATYSPGSYFARNEGSWSVMCMSSTDRRQAVLYHDGLLMGGRIRRAGTARKRAAEKAPACDGRGLSDLSRELLCDFYLSNCML